VAYCILILVLFERCWSEADGSRKRKEIIYLLIYFAFGRVLEQYVDVE
jgi:hypothetical protein